MEEKLLTAGEFAKLARTTKRTVVWYANQGILIPFEVGENEYRYYRPHQILDFQVILLLRKLRFSIDEIKAYLDKNHSLKDLFKVKREFVVKEISEFQKTLNDLDGYYANLDFNGTLVTPKIKEVKAFSTYYLDKEGPYSKIKDYCLELKSYFAKIPKNAVYLTLFDEGEYKPKKAKMKIGVICRKEMVLRKDVGDLVKQMEVPNFKALTYVHNGSGALLSLLWQELARYKYKECYKLNRGLPFFDLEFYHKTSLNEPMDESDMVFEIILPIT